MKGGWRRSRRIAALLFTAVLAVQVIVPTSRLIGPGHAQRFGWQMFSGSEAFPEFLVITSTGEEEVDLADYLLRQRVELDVVGVVPPHLCEVVPDAVAVRWNGGSHRC